MTLEGVEEVEGVQERHEDTGVERIPGRLHHVNMGVPGRSHHVRHATEEDGGTMGAKSLPVRPHNAMPQLARHATRDALASTSTRGSASFTQRLSHTFGTLIFSRWPPLHARLAACLGRLRARLGGRGHRDRAAIFSMFISQPWHHLLFCICIGFGGQPVGMRHPRSHGSIAHR